jgi:hypothetical protein
MSSPPAAQSPTLDSSTPTKRAAQVVDWQGQRWTVCEAYGTAHGFEVYRGHTAAQVSRGPRLVCVLTPALAGYIRATRSSDLRLPLSRTTLLKMRRALGIAPTRAPAQYDFKWTPARLALLGTASDHAVGAMLGVAFSAVRDKRYALGVAAFKLQFWSVQRLVLLGTRPDRELAQQLGTTYLAVAGMRAKWGIPAFGRLQRRGKRAQSRQAA